LGSFSRYLIDTYGIEKFKVLYKTGDFSVYNKSLGELNSEWRSFLDSIDMPEDVYVLAEYRFSQPSIFQGKCPRKVAALKAEGLKEYKDRDFYKAREIFIEALSIDKNDPMLIDSLAYCYYFNKDYEKLNLLVDSELSLPKVDEDILQNLRGNALWQEGQVEESESVFRTILSHPIPDNLERELELKISAINAGGTIEEGVKSFFSTRDELIQITELEEIIRQFPYYSPPYYLLGRIFYNNREFYRAAEYLKESEELGLPSRKLQLENLRLLGISLFATGDNSGAIKRFRRIIFIEPKGTLADYAGDFIERSNWVGNRNLNE